MSPRTKWKDLARFQLVVPADLAEQQALLRILQAASDKVIATRAAAHAAAVVRRALLATCFADDGPVVEGWMQTTLGEHFNCRSGATPRRSEHERYFTDDGIPWVKTLDLNEGVVRDTKEHITPAAVAETSCRINDVGTVMVAMYGGFNQIGRTGMLGVAAASNQAVCCLSPKREGAVLPKLALYALQANRRKWRRVAASSRKDPNITKRDVERFSLRAPLEPSAQSELCDRVESIDRLIAELESAVFVASRVEQALINRFVAGEL
jgi:type I restriction enzyme S subunit